MNEPSTQPAASPVQALMAASGHTKKDAQTIVANLRAAGWVLIAPSWAAPPTNFDMSHRPGDGA